jgi:predicted RNase H-like HicB family nuclease
MTYSVTLEHGSDGSYLAWVHELPGCFARGSSREEVKERLPDEIRAFLGWLRASGEDVEDDEGFVIVVDEVDSVIDSSEDTEVLLDPDRQPLTEDDWERVERWLSHSRHDLIERLEGANLGSIPEGETRTERELLVHIAFVELMYAAWTFDLHDREGLRDFLDWTRVISRARMRALAARGDDTVTKAEWAGAPRTETWTARKAARRLVWHELLHLRGASSS